MTPTLLSSLRADRLRIDEYLDSLLRQQAGSPVGEAMRYSVLGAGQRLRPLLSLRVARMLECESDLTLRAAASVELLHCASLVVDDLPCMDDSTMRRDRPCTHLVFGEATSLLASFALVALAAKSLVDPTEAQWEMDKMVAFQRRLLSTLDCKSLIGGQALDLQLTGETRQRALPQLSELKTVPLFQLAMHAGAVTAIQTCELEQALQCFGREFGLAYQMADDVEDGETLSMRAMRAQLARVRECVARFGGRAHAFEDLLEYLDGKTFQANRSHR